LKPFVLLQNTNYRDIIERLLRAAQGVLWSRMRLLLPRLRITDLTLLKTVFVYYRSVFFNRGSRNLSVPQNM